MNNRGIPFDGYASVLEMLQKADVGFRERILNSLRKRDPSLARRLESNLRNSYSDSASALAQTQRMVLTRGYGH
jgi:hypothetical protein